MDVVHIFVIPGTSLYAVFYLNFTSWDPLRNSDIPALIGVKWLKKTEKKKKTKKKEKSETENKTKQKSERKRQKVKETR